MTNKDLIKILLDYPMDVDITIYDRNTKSNKELIYVGSSPNDKEAWHNDNEIPNKASYVEFLIG